MFAPTNPFPQTRLLEPASVLRMFLGAQYFLAFCLQGGFFWECVVLLCWECVVYFVCSVRGNFCLQFVRILCLQCAKIFCLRCAKVFWFAVFWVCVSAVRRMYFVFRVGLYFMSGVRIYFVCSAFYFAR